MWLVVPALGRETSELVRDLPVIIANLLTQLFGADRVEILGQIIDARSINIYLERGLAQTVGEPTGAIHVAAVAVEFVLRGFLTIVLLIYFLLNPRPFAMMLLRLAPVGQRQRVRQISWEIHLILGRYLRGLAFLVVLMSTLTWIGLTFIFHLPYSLPIAIATGFLEIIPFLGPVTAGAIASAVALASGGPQVALGVAIMYFVLRQMEDHLVMPIVIGHAVELHPAVTIFAVLAGTVLWGVLGALLAIPVAAAVKIVFQHIRPA